MLKALFHHTQKQRHFRWPSYIAMSTLSTTYNFTQYLRKAKRGDPSYSRSVLGVHWKDWCWSWSTNTLATSCKELTHWKRPWCWEGLGAGGEGDDRGQDGWMTSPTRWTCVWVNSGSWWWTGRPGMLRFTGSQSQTWLSDWTELNWSKY